MRRNRIQVSSGTYCNALAQLDLRMMSQIDLTKLESDCVEAIDRGAFGALALLRALELFFGRAIFTLLQISVQAVGRAAD